MITLLIVVLMLFVARRAAFLAAQPELGLCAERPADGRPRRPRGPGALGPVVTGGSRMANTAVFGIYPSTDGVESAVGELRNQGFRSTDISVLWPQNLGSKDLAHARATKAPKARPQVPDPARWSARRSDGWSGSACWRFQGSISSSLPAPSSPRWRGRRRRRHRRPHRRGRRIRHSRSTRRSATRDASARAASCCQSTPTTTTGPGAPSKCFGARVLSTSPRSAKSKGDFANGERPGKR